MLLIRDLGELVVERDGQRYDPGGAKPRTILSVLCAHGGEHVSASALIAEVWGADAPDKTQRALESQIWRLRKAISPASESPAIVTDRAGYRIDLTTVSVDSVEFAAIAARMLERTPTIGQLDEALNLWRGEPFTTSAATPTIDQARRHLHTVRASLLSRRADLLLAAGEHQRALDEAQALITRDPLDEHAWALKITALAASGHRAEALTAYRDVRELLATELGVDPGAAVRAAHRGVLDEHSRSVRRVHLPSQHTSFVGRETELATLGRLLGTVRAVSLTGMPGVGKTRLAIEAARRAADVFDDGVWFVPRRRGVDDATAVLAAMRIQPSTDAPTDLDRLCDHLATRSALLVVDGPPGPESAATVAAILHRCAAVSVLGVGAPHGVDGENVVTVHPLPTDGADRGPSPAHRVLVDRIRVATGLFDPGPRDRADIDRICGAVGGLPLGLELAAARVSPFSLHEVAEQFGATVPEPIGRAFALAYDSLGDELASDFQRITALGSPFTASLAQSVCGPVEVADVLAELQRRSLLWPIRGDRHRPTRFAILGTVAAHARRADEAAAALALTRRDVAVAALLASDSRRSARPTVRDYERIDNDLSTVVAFLESVVTDPARLDRYVDELERLGSYWYLRRRHADGIRLLRTAAETCARGGCSPRTDAIVALSLGTVLGFSQLTDESHARLTTLSLDAIDAVVTPGDTDPDTRCLRLGVLSLAAWVGDDHALALEFAQRANAALATGSGSMAATVTAALALSEATAGDLTAATEHAHTALVLGTELGDPLAQHLATVLMGIGALFAGDSRMGLRWNDQAFRSYLDAGGVQVCDTVEQRGNHLASAGELSRAGRAFAVARSYAVDAGLAWPRGPFTHDAIRRCREADDVAFEAGWREGVAAAQEALQAGDPERFAGM